MKSRDFAALPQSRSEAKRLGIDRYFTGEPCTRGHISLRYLGGNCAACQVENARKVGGWKARPTKADYLIRARELVEARAGILLSKKYVSAKSKLDVKCSSGHEFKISYDHLKRGNWCRTCGYGASAEKRKSYTLKQLKNWALRRHRGTCLASDPTSTHEKILWKCSNSSHKPFKSTISNTIHNGAWCPTCWAERRRPPTPPIPKHRIEAIVAERGGSIAKVVGAWRGGQTELHIRCANGHQWSVMAASLVYAGSWCPNCSFKGERIVRGIFEATFRTKFPKSRPSWLRSKTGRPLELDGYSEQLQLAFEYQGPHHVSKSSVREHDTIKRRLCKARGIRLIEIEAIKNPFPPQNVLRSTAEAFRKFGLSQTPTLPPIDIFPNELEQLRLLARNRGGELVSIAYLGSKNPHEWKCHKLDHPPWRALYSNIRKGSWCPSCARNRPLGIDGLREWGQAHKLCLIGTKYRGANAVYHWRCLKESHSIRRSKSNIEQSLRRGVAVCSNCVRE